MSKERRPLIEEEQRARIRRAALEHEQRLLARHKLGDTSVEPALAEVRVTLDRVGREQGYVERVAIERHAERLKERRA